jgi:phosphoribosylamine-glycine ligase
MSTSRALAIIAHADTIPEAGSTVDRCLTSVSGKYYVRRDIGTLKMLDEKLSRTVGKME